MGLSAALAIMAAECRVSCFRSRYDTGIYEKPYCLCIDRKDYASMVGKPPSQRTYTEADPPKTVDPAPTPTAKIGHEVQIHDYYTETYHGSYDLDDELPGPDPSPSPKFDWLDFYSKLRLSTKKEAAE